MNNNTAWVTASLSDVPVSDRIIGLESDYAYGYSAGYKKQAQTMNAGAAGTGGILGALAYAMLSSMAKK